MEKSDLRQSIKKSLAKMPLEVRIEKSRRLISHVMEQKAWQDSELILAFLSFDTEVELDDLLEASLKAGKRVAVPHITGEGEMDFIRLKTLEDVSLNAIGIREPLSGTVLIPEEEKGLLLVPGLAFDREGRRLGRGGGYYDRYLTRLKKGSFQIIAAAFQTQIVKSVPASSFDLPIDGFVTEEGWFALQ